MTLAVVVTGTFAAVLFVFARSIGGFFTGDPRTLSFAVDWIRVLAVGTVFQSVFSVLRGGLQGAGDTTWPLYASLLGITAFSLGFSYTVGVYLGAGIVGVYLGIVLDYLTRSAIVYYRFASGRWKHVDVGVRRTAADQD